MATNATLSPEASSFVKVGSIVAAARMKKIFGGGGRKGAKKKFIRKKRENGRRIMEERVNALIFQEQRTRDSISL